MMIANPHKPHKTVFVSGNFFVLHPGHIRILKFASELGMHLYVGVNDTRPSIDYPSAQERAETLQELGLVHQAIVLKDGLEGYLKILKPDLIVKGKEYEELNNPEEEWLKLWGGKLAFAAGDASYSGVAILRDSAPEESKIWHQPIDYIKRHDCYRESLMPFIEKFKELHVGVIGDVIIDEYIQCEALGMSREDPTLVVSPRDSKLFLGGAGIVAAHCKGLGGKVTLFSAIGQDDLSNWVKQKLDEYHVSTKIICDDSRPTTLKQRYRVAQKTLMRVSHLRQHEISADLQNQIYSWVKKEIGNLDCIIFSDFNYGVLPQGLVDKLIALGRENGVYMSADSQTSSQIGDISRFSNIDLITPTEHEARVSLRDYVSGLHIVAEELMKKSQPSLEIITLGESGSLVVNRNQEMDRLPALNSSPVDISGAGDSMLVGVSLSKTLGLNDFQASYIGAICAAIQVGQLGNVPIKVADIKSSLV